MLFSAAVLILLSAAPQLTSPEDTLLDVGEYRMHLVVHRGTTPLTIVMESGGGASLDAWAAWTAGSRSGPGQLWSPMTGPDSAEARRARAISCRSSRPAS